MRIAFKEWAVVVDALGQGEQIIILRKGGIQEGRSGFQVEHNRFLLFPTLFHQQRDAVIPSAQRRFDALSASLRRDVVPLEHCAEIVDWKRIASLDAALALRGQHVWREEVVRERFAWGRSESLYAMAVRVFRLAQAVELPLLARYGGCKSWVELDEPISAEGAQPVLTDHEFAHKLERFLAVLEPRPAPAITHA